MIITTTNSVENAAVEKYLGVVTANLAIGVSSFSELIIYFSDVFGGLSGEYRREMDRVYRSAYDALTLKASKLGANGVVGFKIDFDEISGRGTQMLMISVSGTAVKLKFNQSGAIGADEPGSVSHDAVNIAVFKLGWQRRQKSNTPTNADLNFIMENGLWELAPSLYEYYATENMTYDVRPIDERFPVILSLLSYDEAVPIIYKDYVNLRKYAFPLIKSNRLFSARNVLDMLDEGNLDPAIELLDTEKDTYTMEDVSLMEAIIDHLDNLPDKGQIIEVKAGPFSSKTVEKYVCPLGHKNDRVVEFCEHGNTIPLCGLNMKGITEDQTWIIERFKERVAVIRDLLEKKN